MNRCRKLTIFEGPDGAGKTTAALAYAESTGARYVHFGPMFEVTSGLARGYVESMLPALLGHQDLVWDRSWLSETPYGNAFRGGQDRLGDTARRMLERLAMRCATVVVRCSPGWEAIQASFAREDREEMLTNSIQLREVYEAYGRVLTSMPLIDFDYTKGPLSRQDLDVFRTAPHRLDVLSAGNLNSDILLVGEEFGAVKNEDAWYQWPFASFSQQGCSQWLTKRLNAAGIAEDQLRWVNADQPLFAELIKPTDVVIALGTKAEHALLDLGINMTGIFKHPQYHKRFNSGELYPLLPFLQGLLK